MKSRVLVVCSLAMLLLGCASTNDAEDSDGAGADSTPASAADSPVAPAESTPSLVPATGQKLTVTGIDGKVFSFRLPEGDWRLGYGDQGGTLDTPDGPWRITGFTTFSAGEVGPRFYVKGRLQYWRGDERAPKQLDDRTVDGVEGYVLEGSATDALLYEYGAVSGDAVVWVQFEFPQDTPKGRAWIESVLASAEWL